MNSCLANVLNQESLHIQVYRDEEGVYIAKCLDIPGCVSQGQTKDEALANAHDAITLCLEVIQEDARAGRSGDDSEYDCEVIGRPIQDFLHA
jgi:predicted RNase H-like HicB family nuclease